MYFIEFKVCVIEGNGSRVVVSHQIFLGGGGIFSLRQTHKNDTLIDREQFLEILTNLYSYEKDALYKNCTWCNILCITFFMYIQFIDNVLDYSKE